MVGSIDDGLRLPHGSIALGLDRLEVLIGGVGAHKGATIAAASLRETQEEVGTRVVHLRRPQLARFGRLRGPSEAALLARHEVGLVLLLARSRLHLARLAIRARLRRDGRFGDGALAAKLALDRARHEGADEGGSGGSGVVHRYTTRGK